MNKGLARFGGDGESYVEVLHSFAANTRPLIEALKKADGPGALAAYAVTVHGIKGSSRGIGAGAVGDQAEALEKAAKEGNFDFVAAGTPSFIAAVSKLLTDIEEMLEKNTQRNPKPKKDKPDRETLLKLLGACEKYYMDGADGAMAEIEAYEYTSDDGLAAWLRQNIDQMNFAEIKERLSTMVDK
jgi:HPt (histidine-containing phosphotransfer) domain-containing protein